MQLLDTNIIVHYLTKNDEKKAEASYRLLQKIQQGKESVVTTELIVAEVTYVLGSPHGLFRYPHDQIRALLLPLLMLTGVTCAHKTLLMKALAYYERYPRLDFEDAYSIVVMQQKKIEEIFSYDKDFEGISGIKRQEP
jgi:predicted nucleic acid-binding protein